MTMCDYARWELPEFEMIAGESKHLQFPLYNEEKQLVDMGSTNGSLAVADYVNRSHCLLRVPCQLYNDVTHDKHIFTAELQPEHTRALCGKYIYQLTVRDAEGKITVLRGVVTIHNNSDPTVTITGEVEDETLHLYAESGAPIHAEVKNGTLCIG